MGKAVVTSVTIASRSQEQVFDPGAGKTDDASMRPFFDNEVLSASIQSRQTRELNLYLWEVLSDEIHFSSSLMSKQIDCHLEIAPVDIVASLSGVIPTC